VMRTEGARTPTLAKRQPRSIRRAQPECSCWRSPQPPPTPRRGAKRRPRPPRGRRFCRDPLKRRAGPPATSISLAPSAASGEPASRFGASHVAAP
jgi:hypothetical protein